MFLGRTASTILMSAAIVFSPKSLASLEYNKNPFDLLTCSPMIEKLAYKLCYNEASNLVKWGASRITRDSIKENVREHVDFPKYVLGGEKLYGRKIQGKEFEAKYLDAIYQAEYIFPPEFSAGIEINDHQTVFESILHINRFPATKQLASVKKQIDESIILATKHFGLTEVIYGFVYNEVNRPTTKSEWLDQVEIPKQLFIAIKIPKTQKVVTYLINNEVVKKDLGNENYRIDRKLLEKKLGFKLF